MDRGPQPPRAFGDGRAGKGGLGAAVGRRVHAADPVAGAARCHCFGLGPAQHMAVHLVLARPQGPFLPLGEVGGPRGDVHQAGPAKSRLDPQLAPEVAPEFQALHGKWQFAQVAVLLAAPAPVAAGLFAADTALVDQGDRDTLLRQGIGRGAAGDSRPDHHDVGRGGQPFVTQNRLHGWRHRRVP